MNIFNEEKLQKFNVSVCICTRNRPEDLSKALKSVDKSTYPAHEVIVSDDSTNNETKVLVETHFPTVKYLSGPRKGLGSNRNNALKAVKGTHVLFIDDDVVLNESFLEMIHEQLNKEAEQGLIKNLIVSGIENKNGQLVFPGEQSFLGYQNVSYQEGDVLRTVVINSAVFPATLFQEVLFDEKLVYGNDEVDLTTRATRKGYKITLLPEAINFHYPSEINRDYYNPYHDATRIYVTFKRYFDTEDTKIKALIYLPYALIYAAARNFKYKGFKSFSDTFNTFNKSLRFIADFLTSNSSS